MPRCVFQLLWQSIAAGNEIFAYVKNMAKNGDYYWVFAQVTQSYDANVKLDSYHSNRRLQSPAALAQAEPLYCAQLAATQRRADSKHRPTGGGATHVQQRTEAVRTSYAERRSAK